MRYGIRVGDGDAESVMSATRDAGFGREVKRRIILGTYALSSGYYDAYYLRAQKVRALILRDFDEAFAGVDALLDEVRPDASFVDDLNADSLDLVELIMSLEEEFGTEISDEDAERIRTVQDAVDYIEEHAS